MGRLNKPAKDGYIYRSPGQTNAKDLTPGQDVIYKLENPIKKSGHLRILKGNLSPKGAVAKITGKEGLLFSGPARVFNSEYEANDGIRDGLVKKGDVVVMYR